jgi:hypothetical protein
MDNNFIVIVKKIKNIYQYNMADYNFTIIKTRATDLQINDTFIFRSCNFQVIENKIFIIKYCTLKAKSLNSNIKVMFQ